MNEDKDKYLRIDGVITVPKTSGLTVKELETKFLQFIEENKCFFGGGSSEVDSDGNVLNWGKDAS